MSLYSRLAPEWAAQSAIMLIWPHPQTAWEPILAVIEPLFISLASTIARYESLVIIVHNELLLNKVTAQLQEAGVPKTRVHYYIIPNNDTWARDCGPMTVQDSNSNPPHLTLLDFKFNGWGQKFPAELDNAITRQLHIQPPFNQLSYVKIPWVLEGGSIDVNGEGCLLTTSRCLLDKRRNPNATRTAWEDKFRTLLDIEKVLWLDHGALQGDDTDSHIDILARFIRPDTIVYTHCDDPNDEHYPALQHMEQQLRTFTQNNGQPFQLIPLPWPKPQYHEGRRLATSYVNFLMINGAVLIPLYDDPADALTLQIFDQQLPSLNIIGIPCAPLLQQNGSLHCLTMPFPHGVLT